MRSEVHTAASMVIFWVVVQCNVVEIYRHFRGVRYFHYQGDASIIALRMEAACISETSVNLYQITRISNPEDGHLLTRHLEDIKSHCFIVLLTS
jgi:hypothetical protein